MENMRAKGPGLKIGKDRALAEYIEAKILYEDYSPAAVLGEIARSPELNGSEFADCKGMERSCRRRGQWTTVYYCHPYASSAELFAEELARL